jgi:hypothetical protein
MATAPNFGAGTVDNPPKKLPIGVLAADTITTSLLIFKVFDFIWRKINQILGDFGMNCSITNLIVVANI